MTRFYFPNTPNKPGLDQLSSADRKARITSKTNWFAEPLEASHDGRRADIRSGGLWVELFRALHASRRQAAVRELSKYRHLVQDAQPLDVSSPGSVPEPSAAAQQGKLDIRAGTGSPAACLFCRDPRDRDSPHRISDPLAFSVLVGASAGLG